MSTNNTVVTNAINSLNEAAKNKAEQAAACLISQIRGLNLSISNNSVAITRLQGDIRKVEGDEISFESVVGQTPGNTANTSTVADVIGKMNKDRQAEIASRANPLAHAIQSLQDDNIRLNKALAKLREELSKITVETVNETAVLG